MGKKILLSTTLLVLVLLLTACGGRENISEDGIPRFMSLHTGGTSGTYYPLGGEIAKTISDETGIQTDAVSSNASAENVISLQEGNAEIAFVQTDVIANAIDGVNIFDGNPVDNVLALGSLYPETVQIVTRADSGIESVEDLKGKTISIGAPGSGVYVNATQILEAHGITLDDVDAQNLDFGESTSGIQDRNIDAAFITAGTPSGAVEGLGATTDVSIVPIEEEKVKELIEKYPYYAEDTVPKGTYGLENEVSTVAVLAMLAVTDALAEDIVYDMTKALYENVDKISHAKAQFISKETALNGIGIELHPGAERYFREEGLLDR